MSQVFVAYAHDDRAEVMSILRELWNHGIHTLWDQELAPGEAWRETIKKWIESADNFLCVVSPRSVKSQEVAIELELAQESGRAVYCLEIEGVSEASLESLRTRQWFQKADLPALADRLRRSFLQTSTWGQFRRFFRREMDSSRIDVLVQHTEAETFRVFDAEGKADQFVNPERVVLLRDLQAAGEITDLFWSMGIGAKPIQEHSKHEHALPEGTFFGIGLLCHTVVRNAQARCNDAFQVCIAGSGEELGDADSAVGGPRRTIFKIDGKLFDRQALSHEGDYAVLVRIVRRNANPFFLCGGCGSAGTKAAATFLRKDWASMLALYDEHNCDVAKHNLILPLEAKGGPPNDVVRPLGPVFVETW